MKTSKDSPIRHVVGCMSGTSLDGLDLARVELCGQGRELVAGTIQHAHVGLGDLQSRLREATTESLTAAQWTRLALDLGILHAKAIQEAWPDEPIDLVAAHGQTLHHAPPESLQLLNPWPIAHALDCTVVCDLRGADLIAGGQGAPITPLADLVLYRPLIGDTGLTILNLGGFANATVIAPPNLEAPDGFDCCPCNHLLDAAARTFLGKPYDEDGRVAESGTPDPGVAAELAESISRLRTERRSGGSGDEGIELALDTCRRMDGADIGDQLATLAEAIARSVATAMPDSPPDRICLAGGGARNNALRKALDRHLSGSIEEMENALVPIDAREAAGMAVLGCLAMDGSPITFPGITGRAGSAAFDGVWINLPGS